MGYRYCESCLLKQQEIDRLKQEIEHLKNKLKNQQQKEKEGYFGPSTPSSKKPFKEKTKNNNGNKNGGGQKGHKGAGRKIVSEEDADEIIILESDENCPNCGDKLEDKGTKKRTVIDTDDHRAKKKLYKSKKKWCPRCRKTFQTKPDVINNGLYGNKLVAQSSVKHYYHGIPMGRIEQIYGPNVSYGSLFDVYHRIAKLLKEAVDKIIIDFRNENVKQADETGWRNDGENGYAWIFCSEYTTIFKFKDTRSGQVARDVLGKESLKGYLVVDRYGGYNKIKIKIQYCYAHLLRDVEKLGKEFANEKEVEIFVSNLSYQLSCAMHLQGKGLNDDEYYKEADSIKKEILKLTKTNFKHLGIINIQTIFNENEDRLYHWAEDRNVPAHNNRSERELRPTVVARKVSFGSQSSQGMKTREILMTYLHTAKKRLKDKPLEVWFKEVLDQIAHNPKCDLYKLLPPLPT